MTLYSKAAAETEDPQGKALLTRLATEEQGHLDLLESEHEWLRRSGEYFTIHRFPPSRPS